ncbi:MAG: transglutaminase domain-containing protein [Planctomycetales bacterium]|nr:transglutaminase domain-containing protein [Planctomycetales bacterium]
MPSSGGQAWSSPFATSGVGDGEQMVSGTDDAKSFGPIDSGIFLESEQPSIYDIFNDMYSEPTSRKRKVTRSIPLAPQDTKMNHQHLARTEQATREFTAVRRPSAPKPKNLKLDTIRSDALFYVSGRVPVHLAHEYYNCWDGQTLSHDGMASLPQLALSQANNQNWVTWQGATSSFDVTPTVEDRVLRMARFQSARVPSPANMQAVHIDRIHSAAFFAWTPDRVLCFARDQIPSLTVLHLRSLGVNRNALDGQVFQRSAMPDGLPLDPGVTQLLKQWTRNAKTDWQTIQAVAQGIRQRCQLDPERTIHSEGECSRDVVQSFLMDQQSGQDYLFAITTARLLRQLGYRVQVVSGFYAQPQNYHPVARQTAVYPEDIHFWVEVQTDKGVSVIVDACPGYEVMSAELSGWQKAVACVQSLVGWTIANQTILLPMFAAWALIVWWRQRVYVGFLTLLWAWPGKRTNRTLVRWTLTLLDARCRLHKHIRPQHCPVEKWLDRLIEATPSDHGHELLVFRGLVQWALYSPNTTAIDSHEVRRICRQSLRTLSPRRFSSAPIAIGVPQQ